MEDGALIKCWDEPKCTLFVLSDEPIRHGPKTKRGLPQPYTSKVFKITPLLLFGIGPNN